jgi:hypothetical protein
MYTHILLVSLPDELVASVLRLGSRLKQSLLCGF